MSCLFNPGSCIQSAFYNVITGVPWWGWVLVILVVLGFAWRFAGIPGLVAAAAGLGFIAGKFGPAKLVNPTADQTAWDKQNNNSGDFYPHKQPDQPSATHPSGKTGPIPGWDYENDTWFSNEK